MRNKVNCRSRKNRSGRRRTTPSIRPSEFAEFLAELKRQPRFCIDTETTAIDPLRADLVGLSFCWKSGEAYYLPVRGPAGSSLLDPATTLEALRAVLADPNDRESRPEHQVRHALARPRGHRHSPGPITDTMVLSYLLESGERNHNLDQLSQRLLDHTMIPITDLIGKGKTPGTDGRGRRRPGGRICRRRRRRDLADRDDPDGQGARAGALDAVCRARAAA